MAVINKKFTVQSGRVTGKQVVKQFATW